MTDGKKFLGIYVFEKEDLKMCVGGIDEARPAKFAAPVGKELTLLMVLKREKK